MNKNDKSFAALKWLAQILFAVYLLMVFTSFAQPSSQTNNGKIAFVRNDEIYVMNIDGSGQVNLTSSADLEFSPAWSPDGRRLAFMSNTSSGHFLKLMNADGSNQMTLTHVIYPLTFASNLSWSPDSRKIAFSSAGDIFTINADGSTPVNLTNHPATDFHPSWSPDGSRIAFTSHRSPNIQSPHTFIMNADGSNAQLWQPSIGLSDTYRAKWSPDAQRFLFESSDGLNCNCLFTRNINDLTGSSIFLDGLAGYADWSPDGAKIVFSRFEINGTRQHISIIHADGGNFTTITEGSQPDWQPRPSSVFADFDGDRRSDISVFRPFDRVWYLNRSTQGFSASQFGLPSDKITPADFDGDGKTDIAVFRDGVWYWLNSSNDNFNAVQFGLATDVPVPADFTGDGQDELAVYRKGIWFTLNLQNNQFNAVQFGISNDKPAVGDYDADGLSDYAVYRDGFWYLLKSTEGFSAIQFGLSNDKAVPADYDGDGKTDIAVFRDGIWYLLRSRTGFEAIQFGLETDTPAPADYDGDGKADASVFRDGIWYLRQSANGFSAVQFGHADDKPIPNAFVR